MFHKKNLQESIDSLENTINQLLEFFSGDRESMNYSAIERICEYPRSYKMSADSRMRVYSTCATPEEVNHIQDLITTHEDKMDYQYTISTSGTMFRVTCGVPETIEQDYTYLTQQQLSDIADAAKHDLFRVMYTIMMAERAHKRTYDVTIPNGVIHINDGVIEVTAKP